MAPTTIHLPNGQTLTVTPVFGGFAFRLNELNIHHNVFPPGWSINLHSEDSDDDGEDSRPTHAPGEHHAGEHLAPRRHHSHRFRNPTLRNDHLFISSISNPSSNDFRPASSPTRQIAMMLWATLLWYFHQPAPSPQLNTSAASKTPEAGRPRGDWRVNIDREGIFMGKHLLPKLERMGLIASEDSSVGADPDDGVSAAREGWNKMFVSQRSFWQLDARIYLFSLSPAQLGSPYPSLSPATSRPGSPNRASMRGDEVVNSSTAGPNHHGRANTPPGPFTSGSHLPTFYPPPPAQYIFTNGLRHPVRPKPPRQGETFYTRFIPSLDQYLSFRIASLSRLPVGHRGPMSPSSPEAALQNARDVLRSSQLSSHDPQVSALANLSINDKDASSLSDTQLLHKWMNDPRVATSWGEDGPIAHQEQFLRDGLTSRHSMPVIGCFDGKPFGYFEIYWVKEDRLAAHLDGGCGDWDRGLHVLVGEQQFRGPHRIKVWLSALVHYCLLADMRTNVVMMEPRVDNDKLRKYTEQVGFFKEKEVTFAHKQSNLMKIRREAFNSPEL